MVALYILFQIPQIYYDYANGIFFLYVFSIRFLLVPSKQCAL